MQESSGWAWVDGIISSDSQARISVLDHGFLYGDSVYEAVRTWDRKPFLLEPHLQRLQRSAAGLLIPMPQNVVAAVEEILTYGEGERLLRIIVTRGQGSLGYQIDPQQQPGLVVLSRPVPTYPQRVYEEGVHLAVVDVRRTSRVSLDPLLKTSNLLNLRLAFMEARRKGADDAVLLNAAGDVAESSGSNIFAVTEDGTLLTPPLESGILEGITRAYVMQLAADLKQPVEQQRLRIEQLRLAREAFITSTTRSIMPVTKLDGAPIGDSRPGPITRRLISAFEQSVGRQLGD